MSDWGWVAFAYTVVYTTLGVYALLLIRRRRHLERDIGLQ